MLLPAHTIEPIVSLQNGEVVWGELLCREPGFADWDDRHWRDWYEAIPAMLVSSGYAQMTVNCDSGHLLDGRIFDGLCELSQLPITAPRVLLEWTERDDGPISLEAALEVGRRLNVLRNDAGLGIALDDVGAGKDGLGRMSYIQPDLIKIDGRILHEARSNVWLRGVLQQYVSLYRNQHLPVVVEWVEDLRDLEIARSLGAQYGQGYFWTFPS